MEKVNQLELTVNEQAFLGSMLDIGPYTASKNGETPKKDSSHCDPCDACGPDACYPDDVYFLN